MIYHLMKDNPFLLTLIKHTYLNQVSMHQADTSQSHSQLLSVIMYVNIAMPCQSSGRLD